MSRNRKNRLIDYALCALAVLLTVGVLVGMMTRAHAQLVVQPPPMVVQPPPVVVPLPPPQPPPVACAAVTWGPPLNLRAWPNGPWLATYWQGTRVVVDGADGNWVHAQVGPASGWMYAPYLIPVPCWF